ncbi:MAG: putative DNA-binding protein [Firmicutes bacterium]|nr:putative DNA-binding protein [Bacillota bacterium]
MDKTIRMSLLFDFYGPLLTDRQRDIFQMYFHEDLSLAEIGKALDVSRQAVYDILKRSGLIMEEYEGKLSLLLKHQKQQEFYRIVLASIQDLRSRGEGFLECLNELESKILEAESGS